MSLLKMYFSLPFIPLAIQWTTLPFRFIKYKALAKQGLWDLNNPMQNFERLSNAKPRELAGRICPMNLYDLTPLIHHGTLGLASPKEATDFFNLVKESISIFAGLGAASIPALKFFAKCIKTSGADIGVCAKTTLQDLFAYSGVPLLVGAYVVSRLVKTFLVIPAVAVVTGDPYDLLRMEILKQQYGNILNLLNQILDKPISDPQFQATARLAIRFLVLYPHIEKELCDSLALKKEDVQKILAPIQGACNQILAKQRTAG